MTERKRSLCKGKFVGRWAAKSRTTFAKRVTTDESAIVNVTLTEGRLGYIPATELCKGIERIEWQMPRSSLTCPKCGSPEYFALGELGLLFWVRCRACGWDFVFSRPSVRTK